MKHKPDNTSKPSETRIEKDSLGEVRLPKAALYGAQTQRALDNFPSSGIKMPPVFIHALARVKAACAKVNKDLQLLDPKIADAIMDAADSVAEGLYDAEFPIDVFQTGSGTSTNMNANEVIANIANLRSNNTLSIHPNDHVNMSQSSNDVIPTTIHVSCSLGARLLLPALDHLATVIETRAKSLSSIVKTGRTHLMDAMPLTFGQELSAWATQIRQGIQRIESTLPRLHALAIGGTAVGTGINAPSDFGKRVAVELSNNTAIPFTPHTNYFMALSTQDTIVEFSGQCKVLAVSLTKIANDLRLMNSGPLTGFGDIELPALQPGSSIMPGKVNPVIPEAVCMAAAQVIGNDTTITLSGLSGHFQLNTMLPVIASNILHSIELITHSSIILADKAIRGFVVKEKHIQEQLSRNPILITALNPIIGYEKGAEIVKRAYQEQRSIKEIAKEMTNLSMEELDRLLNPKLLTHSDVKREK